MLHAWQPETVATYIKATMGEVLSSTTFEFRAKLTLGLQPYYVLRDIPQAPE